jgi:hypothetical protein
MAVKIRLAAGDARLLADHQRAATSTQAASACFSFGASVGASGAWFRAFFLASARSLRRDDWRSGRRRGGSRRALMRILRARALGGRRGLRRALMRILRARALDGRGVRGARCARGIRRGRLFRRSGRLAADRDDEGHHQAPHRIALHTARYRDPGCQRYDLDPGGPLTVTRGRARGARRYSSRSTFDGRGVHMGMSKIPEFPH